MADTAEVEPEGLKKDKPSPTKPPSDSEDTGSGEKSPSTGQTSPDLNGSKTAEGSSDPDSKEPSQSPVNPESKDSSQSPVDPASKEPSQSPTGSDDQMPEKVEVSSETKDTPSPVDTDSGGRMSDSREGKVKDKPDLSSDDDEYDDDDSSSEDIIDTDYLDTLYRQIEEQISSTSLEEVLKKLDDRIAKASEWLPDEDEFHGIDYEHELDVIDGIETEPWEVSDESNPAVQDLEGLCWRIMDNAKRCHVSEEWKTFYNTQMGRALKLMEVVDLDMCEMARDTVPVVKDLSDVKNLTTVFRYLSAKGKVAVKVKQIKEKIDAERVLSHYNGFASFREEDMPDLEYNSSRIKVVCDKYDELRPYLKVYVEETEPLIEMDGKWGTVKMTVSELQEWKTGLEELEETKNKLLSFLKIINQDMEQVFGDYCYFQKYLTSNLNSFLNLDITDLFNKQSSIRKYKY